MATLQELKNQIDAANELGVTNITKNGGTISSDATTAEIMAEIDNLPAGGGGAPTVVNEITWDGATEGLESHEVDFGGGVTRTYYKVSDSVLPYAVFNETDYYAYAAVNQDDETSAMTCMAFDGYVGLNSEYVVISAYLDNSESPVFGGVVVPSVGTWFAKNGTDYVKSVTVTEA